MNYRLPTEKVDSIKEYVIRFLKGKLKYREYSVLEDVSFDIYRGESVAIVGRNGVGKSTLLKIISGIIPPTSGNITVNGTMVPMLNIGAGFDDNASGRENVFLNGAILGYSKKEMENKYDEIVEFSELGEFMNVPIKNYSSGMLSRLGFAIAVNTSPDVILVDEILAVGDAKFRQKCSEKMKELQKKALRSSLFRTAKGKWKCFVRGRFFYGIKRFTSTATSIRFIRSTRSKNYGEKRKKDRSDGKNGRNASCGA